VSAGERLVTAGRVGKPHGLDGSFHVGDPQQPLESGTLVTVGGSRRRVERKGGTPERPLLRLGGVTTREAAAALRGELLLVASELKEGEWLAEDLVGCRVAGLGTVERVIAGSSCDLLELDGGVLVPLVADAVTAVDVTRRTIEVDERFLGLDPPGPEIERR
jgi:16S rRNA processing protein RimM